MYAQMSDESDAYTNEVGLNGAAAANPSVTDGDISMSQESEADSSFENMATPLRRLSLSNTDDSNLSSQDSTEDPLRFPSVNASLHLPRFRPEVPTESSCSDSDSQGLSKRQYFPRPVFRGSPTRQFRSQSTMSTPKRSPHKATPKRSPRKPTSPSSLEVPLDKKRKMLDRFKEVVGTDTSETGSDRTDRSTSSKRPTHAQKERSYFEAKERGEIAWYTADHFKCTCRKPGPYKIGSRYAEGKLFQHLRSKGHMDHFLLDGNGNAACDKTGRVLLKATNLPAPPLESGPEKGCRGIADPKYKHLFDSRWNYGAIQKGPGFGTAWPANSFPIDSTQHIPNNRDCILHTTAEHWTIQETADFGAEQLRLSIWKLNREHGTIMSTRCLVRVNDVSGERTCRECIALTFNKTFLEAVTQRSKAASRYAKLDVVAKGAYTQRITQMARKDQQVPMARALRSYLDVPGALDLFNMLQDDTCPNSAIFRKLAKLADVNVFKGQGTLNRLFEMMYDTQARRLDKTGKAMKGIRYHQDVISLFVILRSRGCGATGPHAAMKELLGAPSDSTLRSKQRGFDIPLVIMVDVTVLPTLSKRPPLSYVSVFAEGDVRGHIIGSNLSMAESAIRNNRDLKGVTDRIENEKRVATAVSAVMVSCPLDGVAPRVVALFPTAKKETKPGEKKPEKGAEGRALLETLEQTRAIIEAHGFTVMAYAMDGGGPERLAQKESMIKHSGKDTDGNNLPELSITNPILGVNLATPIVSKHPVIMIQDPEHARKTMRNNMLQGSRLLNLGEALCCYELILRILNFPRHGLVLQDIRNVDKQDDGAALRLFYSQALSSLIVDEQIRTGMKGVFCLLFLFGRSYAATIIYSQADILYTSLADPGELFDAWLNREIPHERRLLSAWRVHFFMQAWRQDHQRLSAAHPLFITPESRLSPEALVIMERVATSLILSIETYAQYHPNRPLMPWNLTTRALEHWFGESRRLFRGDFTMGELLFGLRTQDLRSEIFHTGDPVLRGKPQRTSKVGYLYLNKPLVQNSEAWARLSQYPLQHDRHLSIPQTAHEQTCGLLDFLGMPHPQRDLGKGKTADFPPWIKPEEEEERFEPDVDSVPVVDEHQLPTLPHKPLSFAEIQLEMQITAYEVAETSELEERIMALEKEAEEHLAEITEDTPDTIPPISQVQVKTERKAASEPSDQQPENQPSDCAPKRNGTAKGFKSKVKLPPAPALVSAFDISPYQPFNPSLLLNVRQNGDSSFRLGSEKTRAWQTTIDSQDAAPTTQEDGSMYLRERRQIAAAVDETKMRARTENYRQLRWDSRRDMIMRECDSQDTRRHARYLSGRNVSPQNLLTSDSLVLCLHPGKGTGKNRIPPRFYLARVVGVFQRSGAQRAVNCRVPVLSITKELSALDLYVYEPILGQPNRFSHGRKLLYQTHVEESQMLYHFGPISEHMRMLPIGREVVYALRDGAQATWTALSSQTVSNAIEKAIALASRRPDSNTSGLRGAGPVNRGEDLLLQQDPPETSSLLQESEDREQPREPHRTEDMEVDRRTMEAEEGGADDLEDGNDEDDDQGEDDM